MKTPEIGPLVQGILTVIGMAKLFGLDLNDLRPIDALKWLDEMQREMPP